MLTLDSDTQLPPGRLRELVGVAAHPLNRPRLDAAARRVVGGYGILQPRIVTPLPSPQQMTPYHWLFAGQCGIDPYSAASSEVYQDLFGEGSFTGKGLLDVQAMQAVLAGRLPEGQVLSHDLLEGSLVRCAALSDITLVEDAPFHADVAASRVHRWARGDWQLLPFMLRGTRYPLRAIHRWKMFDNLRRSLVAPLSLALLLLALAGHGLTPWAALGLVLAAFATGPLISAVAGFSPSRDDIAKLHFYRQAGADLLRAVCGALWHLGQLLQQALQSADAIVRALYRLAVSRRHLLQWTTAAVAQASAARDFAPLLRRHRQEPMLAALLLLGLFAVGTPHPAWALALCTLWGLSPVWTWWVSRPRRRLRGPALAAGDSVYLEGIARDTWRYFERCVTAQDRHLPPDNLQTAPHDMLARRTSPTNIGLYLLSVAIARQFGWIGTQELMARLEATLATVATLSQHRGHLLNWYDTASGAPLLPMYVSTVDSGNFCGHLLALAQACLELADAPFDPAAAQRALATARTRLAPLLAARHRLSAEQRDELRWCLADHRATRRSAALDLQAQASAAAADAPRRLRALARTCQQLAAQADFGFLYHRGRHLFHIGYRVAEQVLDAGFYDLLASESRLTSLFAVAKGDVPVRHWASLGRPFFAVGADAGLRSWSGSMFEYLMPTLVLDEPQGSVLEQAHRAALREQIAFATAHQVPWGISECAYAGSDHTLAYQYAPQGVPRLALRRTPSDELVIAPYATALAAQIAVRRACRNFHALQALGARARYGFIEAVDFTPARQAGTAPFSLVQTFMAHHQGMSIVALGNVLLDGVAQRWGSRCALLEAVASLLHERTPREVSVLSAPTVAPPAPVRERRASGLLRDVLPGAAAVEPTHLLSNGRYGVSLRANGAGFSRWGETGLTRWRDDALRDAHGSFFYLRWPQGARKDAPSHPVSITQHPAPDPAAHYRSTFHADRVCFDAVWPGVQVHTTVWVSPEDDIEFRQVEVSNLGERTLEIELLSAFDVTLSDARADEAHPAFMNLFVRAEWQPAQQALWFERKPRLPTEAALRMAHFLADSDAQVVSVRVGADRQRWLGRNRDASQPLADFDTPAATRRRGAGAGHRAGPGVRHGRAAAHRAAGQGPADLCHGGQRPRWHLACGDRQVPPAQPRATRLADVGHAGRHPPAHAACQRRDLRRDPDAEHGAGAEPDAAAVRQPAAPTRPRSATGGCCGASASPATGRCCWCRPARCRTWGCCARWPRGCACGPGAASPATWWWSTARPRPINWHCSANWWRCASATARRVRPSPGWWPRRCTCCAATSCPTTSCPRCAAWRGCTCAPTAARCCTMCRPGSPNTSWRWSNASRCRPRRCPTPRPWRAPRRRRRASSRPSPASSASMSAMRSARRGRGSTCCPTRTSARRCPKPAAATPGR